MTIGFYLRLSESDSDLGEEKDESNSIENQRLLLNDFVESRDDLDGRIKEYVDDGYSGTNFNRPAFKELIEDAKKGIIQVVVVKDLSRLGRDYITTGDYIEQIFPMLNVRFIAVNNGYDSLKISNGNVEFDMAVSNLINTFYSRDLSKKMRNANRIRWKNGINNGTAPFGYVRDKEKSGKWFLDEEAAKIVRIIFDKALEGQGTSQIAYFLNEHNIPTPGEYNKVHKNWKLREPVKPEQERLWDCSKVLSILRRYEYTGALVMGKREPVTIGGHAKRLLPQKDWIIKDGVNEAIVSKEEFEEAQCVIRFQKKPDFITERKYALKGKVRCGNCRTCMDYSDVGAEEVFFCGHGIGVGKFSRCSKEKYSAKYLEGLVLHAVKKHISVLKECSLLAVDKGKREIAEGKKQIKDKREELDVLKSEKIRHYEAYAEGVINKEVYLKKREEANRRIEDLKAEIEICEDKLDQNRNLIHGADTAAKIAENYETEEKLSVEMVDAFVKNVYVYDIHRIEIVYTFDDKLQLSCKNENI